MLAIYFLLRIFALTSHSKWRVVFFPFDRSKFVLNTRIYQAFGLSSQPGKNQKKKTKQKEADSQIVETPITSFHRQSQGHLDMFRNGTNFLPGCRGPFLQDCRSKIDHQKLTCKEHNLLTSSHNLQP